MKKKVLLIVLLLCLIIPTTAFANRQDITLMIDGEEVWSDVPPFIDEGRTYVPARFVGEHLGMTVDYNHYTYERDGFDLFTVTLTDQNGSITQIEDIGIFHEGLYISQVGDSTHSYQIVGDRTFVPIRYIADALHMDIHWNNDTRTVSLITNNNPEFYDLYMTVDYNNDFEPIVELSNIFKLYYNGSRYELYPMGITVKEYMDQYIWEPLKKDENGFLYDVFKNSEKHFYLNNGVIFYKEQGLALALPAS